MLFCLILSDKALNTYNHTLAGKLGELVDGDGSSRFVVHALLLNALAAPYWLLIDTAFTMKGRDILLR